MNERYDPDSTLEAARNLQVAMVDLKNEMRNLSTYGKRNRHYIIALAISLVLDVALTGGVIIAFSRATDANNQADQNRQSQVDTCVSSNQSRKVTTDLWNYILDASSKNPENQTETKRKQIADFRAYMANAYAPRDCSQIGK